MKKRLMLFTLLALFVAHVGSAGDLVKGLERFLREKGVNTDADSLLAAVTTHPNVSIRIAASTLLGEKGDKSVVPSLRRTITAEKDEKVRARIAITLLRLDDTEGIATATEFMRSSGDDGVRLLLAGELARLGNYTGYDIVVHMLRSEKPDVRQRSVTSLSGFLAQCNSSDLTPPPMGLLLRALNDASESVRWQAVLEVPAKCSNADVLSALTRLAREDSATRVRDMARLKMQTLEQEDN